MVDIILEGLRFTGYILSAILIPVATLIIGRKIIKEKRTTGRYNIVRLLTFGIFFCFALMSVFEILVEFSVIPFLSSIFGFNIETINLYSILIGTMVSLGLCLVFYANRWESLYFFSFFFFGGMVIFYFLTGFDAWVEIYIQIAAIISLVFIYFTGFRVKDNGALGLGILFTLAFSTLVIEISFVTQIIILIYDVFIVILSLGYFKVFKEEVVA
ncbi:MAG: hypothetical protein ACFE8E_05750 [Candidatus Hodarchaeota archaeon]